ncbi:MAG: SLBB domain-containing protein [Akkermansiaceae bacterium]|nr:SLBB domain-containing protein [Akkermansiaceae bacterium]MCP5542504.1 SLBB domain-containing protein [Akkermansiaceae bacterium]
MPLASCSLISESGPLKKNIREEGDMEYRLVEVRSRSDLPTHGRTYGLAERPPAIKGPAYSDKIRERDTLHFVITDPSDQSPFYSKGEVFRFGPIEVPADGLVSFPYVGDIQVIDRTLAGVTTDLSERVKPISNTAQVNVVRSDRLPHTANVIGEVKTPGPVPLERGDITSLDLLATSGGPTEAEHLFRYTLRRGGHDYRFDYLGFRQSPFAVEEGDLLTVTTDMSNRFHVMGAINKPITVPFPTPAPTLADALGAATGLDERRSDPSGVFVFRKGSPDIVYTFDLKNPGVMPLVQRFPMKGEDIVYVTEAPLARWNRMISQILPTTVTQAANVGARYAN